MRVRTSSAAAATSSPLQRHEHGEVDGGFDEGQIIIIVVVVVVVVVNDHIITRSTTPPLLHEGQEHHHHQLGHHLPNDKHGEVVSGHHHSSSASSSSSTTPSPLQRHEHGEEVGGAGEAPEDGDDGVEAADLPVGAQGPGDEPQEAEGLVDEEGEEVATVRHGQAESGTR